jgi:peroxiredoxin Q/BCP
MDVGDKVADFSAVDQDGTTHQLSSLLEAGPVVLFFYPKAMTPG